MGGVGGVGNVTNLSGLGMEAYVTVSMAPRWTQIKLKRLGLILAAVLPDKPLSFVCCLIFFLFTSRIEYFHRVPAEMSERGIFTVDNPRAPLRLERICMRLRHSVGLHPPFDSLFH